MSDISSAASRERHGKRRPIPSPSPSAVLAPPAASAVLAVLAAVLAASAALAVAAALSACDGGRAAEPVRNEGSLIVDSLLVLDRYSYGAAACDEVAPEGAGGFGELPDSAAAYMLVISTACYAVSVSIEDTLGVEVDTLRRSFRIRGRQEGDKDRGAEGWIVWDGLDRSGEPLPAAPYLWRMEFDFGEGRIQRYRADIFLFR